MLLTSRSRELLKKIIDAKYPVRVKDLAQEFRVSERTIKYDLDLIRLWLQEHKAELHSQPNKGIWFAGDTAARNKLRSLLATNNKENVFLNQRERVEAIVFDLLLTDTYLAANALAEKIGVSRNTVVADLTEVEKFLQSWRLSLARKAGAGIKLEGTEIDRRLTLEYLLQARLSSAAMFEIMEAVMDRKSFTEMKLPEQLLLSPPELNLLLETVKSLAGRAKEIGVFLADRVVIGLLVRLVVVLARVKAHHELPPEAFSRSKYLDLDHSKVFHTCSEVLSELGGRLNVSFSPQEVRYISLQFVGSNLPFLAEPRVNAQDLPDPAVLVARIILKVSEAVQWPFSTDAELFHNLVAHMSEKLSKYKYGVLEPNPLLGQTIRSYRALFEEVKKACQEVLSPYEIFLTDSDVGYIVLHFEAARERLAESGQVRALVVCGSGRGTARLVKNILENELKNLQVVGVCSAMEVEKALRSHKVDFVVSVLPIDLEVPVVVVNPIPTKQDIGAILNLMKNSKGRSIGREQEKGITPIKAGGQEKDEWAALPAGIFGEDLPFLENLTRDIIIKGFELSQLITDRFRDYLSERSAAGLTLHLMLMVQRLALGIPYVETEADRYLEPGYAPGLRSQVEEVLKANQLSVPAGEINAILRYFHAPEGKGGEKNDPGFTD